MVFGRGHFTPAVVPYVHDIILLSNAFSRVLRNQKAIIYLKIKYASVIDNFKPPNMTMLPKLDEPADSSQWPPACLQDMKDLERTHSFFKNHDRMQDILAKTERDCLYLNIFTPDGNAPDPGWPVMVWIHPGEFISGAISLWDGSTLAAKNKVIVVTVAYRLNMHGFWTDGTWKFPGNIGLMDQVAALHWIKEKIHLFKGSPKDICLFGHDAGAISIGLHMMSGSPSTGMFSRAIAMSGNAFVPGVVKPWKAYEDSKHLVDANVKDRCINIDTGSCLSDSEQIHRYSAGIWGPVINQDYNDFMKFDPKNVFIIGDLSMPLDGRFQKVDLMIGYTQMEDILSVIDNYDVEKGVPESSLNNVIEAIVNHDVSNVDNETDSCTPSFDHLKKAIEFYYKPTPLSTEKMYYEKLVNLVTEQKYGSGTYRQAMEVAGTGASVFVYRFDYKLKTKIPNDADLSSDSLTVPHFYDLPFVWGMPYYQSWSKISAWNNVDRKHTDTVMQLWTNFARSSNPAQGAGTVKWEKFDENSPGIMLLDRNPNMTDPLNPQGVDYKSFVFWNTYYPTVKAAPINCCNMTAGGLQLQYESVTVAMWTFFVGAQYVILN
ncbi:Acetylcholinesterase [Gryllus bimaculatus]|nr:Acetylcholinesterase [Gryllus bimaculatus]